MIVEDMWMDTDDFNLASRDLRLQVLTKLNSRDAIVDVVRDSRGACRNNIWQVSMPGNPGLMMKLVSSSRDPLGRATEVEKFRNIQTKWRDIVKELAFTFPVMVLQLRGPLGNRLDDLIIMRRAPGQDLGSVIKMKMQNGEASAVYKILKEFGVFLHTVHKVYNNMQHCHCQPSTVFYEESGGNFTFIDVSDLGSINTDGGDVEHFAAALRRLCEPYGVEFAKNAECNFRAAAESV